MEIVINDNDSRIQLHRKLEHCVLL